MDTVGVLPYFETHCSGNIFSKSKALRDWSLMCLCWIQSATIEDTPFPSPGITFPDLCESASQSLPWLTTMCSPFLFSFPPQSPYLPEEEPEGGKEGVLVTFLIAMTKYLTRSNLRKEGVVLAYSLEMDNLVRTE